MNLVFLYSILNPELNSDSPSEKSKDVRFVSTKIVIIQTRTSNYHIRLGLELGLPSICGDKNPHIFLLSPQRGV